MEAHLALRVATGRGDSQRSVDAFGALACERQLEPERNGPNRDRHTRRGIAGRRECPIQRGAHIVDHMPVALQPLRGGPGLPIGLRLLERAPVVFGVCARDAIALAAFLELGQRIGPRDVEKPVEGNRAADIGPDERLGDEIGYGIDDRRRGECQLAPGPRSPPPS